MTHAEALDKLIAAVEAGEHPGDLVLCLPDQRTTDWFYAANRDSLDAAKALHEALLPGWGVQNLGTEHYDGTGSWTCRVTGPNFLEDCQQSLGTSTQAARAWLLAALKAYRAGL